MKPGLDRGCAAVLAFLIAFWVIVAIGTLVSIRHIG